MTITLEKKVHYNQWQGWSVTPQEKAKKTTWETETTGKKQHLISTSHIEVSMTYCQSIIQIENYLGRMYPAELEIKDTTESKTSTSYLDFLLSMGRDSQLRTSLYDKRDDFNVRITNFPLLSSNIHLRQPMMFLSHNWYGIPGLALFWEQRDCYISFSSRDLSGNVWNRLSGGSMVDMGISSNIMKSPSRKCYMTFWDETILCHDTLYSLNRDLVTELDLITDFDIVSRRFP